MSGDSVAPAEADLICHSCEGGCVKTGHSEAKAKNPYHLSH
ncbi:MAG: hypothetical protein N2319_03255 [Candidatus Kapabacteria bacterium]|nr:hypothetical protein [Candidatus Kapabacteria bacterium]